MKNKLLVSIAVISLLFNIITILFGTSGSVIGQNSLIIVPTLPKDSSYELVIPNSTITCVNIERNLGLKRGDVESISNNIDSSITIRFKKDVLLTSTQVQTATDTVKGLIPDIQVK